MHISFYSETNACWDKIGFYVHLIVATIIQLILPICIVVLVCMHADKSFETAYGTLLATSAIANGLIVVGAVLFSIKGFADTYKCY